jgi:hypothetical protein
VVSLNCVRRKGCALWSLSRSTQMSNPVVGLISMKASSCPSGDQECGALIYSLVVKRYNPPLPSASFQKRFGGPSLAD